MTASHIEQTFIDAEKLHPDLMEPYTCRLAESESADDKRAIMEMGLRETFKRRYPMPRGCLWPDGSIGNGSEFPSVTIVPRGQAEGESNSNRQGGLFPLSRVSTGQESVE